MSKEIRGEPMVTFDVEGPPIELDLESVWPALQRGGFQRSDAIVAQVGEIYPLGKKLVEPRSVGWLYAVESMPGNDLKSLPDPIHEAEYLCFGLCTAGQAIDDRARQLRTAGEMIESMILDAVALTGLASVGDELGRRIFSWAEKRGLAASRAFSPGAGAAQWGLSSQRLVFDYLPAEQLGVQLTEHCLMKPSKSVSFVIGIGRGLKQAPYAFSCEGCDRIDCDYRHIPESEMVHPSAKQIT